MLKKEYELLKKRQSKQVIRQAGSEVINLNLKQELQSLMPKN